MNKGSKELISQIVNTFANLSNYNNELELNKLINDLEAMNIDDVTDRILVSIYDRLKSGQLQTNDVFENMNLLLQLNPEKYKSSNDLINRVNWLREMNMMHPKMPLSDNHALIIEAFDKFNQLIGTNFDSYYTGGLMGYLATNHPLERYHGDLDLFINENQLQLLKQFVNQSKDFEFISNMNNKETNGHEFKIQYKGTPMSIGLFLFERKEDNEIILKDYYHLNNDPKEELFVNETHLTPEYSKFIFSDNIYLHYNIPYKMQSLEGIYNSKKNSRPKDKYDANIIKDYVNLGIDEMIDNQKNNNYIINRKNANDSIVSKMEEENTYSNIQKPENLEQYLNLKAKEYLSLIYNEYGKYMNQKQKDYLGSLMNSDCIVVESNDTNYKLNHSADYKNTPLAHGARVYNDNKIHFYPFILKDQSEDNLKEKSEGVLMHELFHYFIRPEDMKNDGNDLFNDINHDTSEALVDMCARDINMKYGINQNYNSEYANNVIFMREALNNISNKDERMNLVFHGSVNDIFNKTSINGYDSKKEYINSKNKNTEFNQVIRNISTTIVTDHSDSAERFLLNKSANCESKGVALQQVNNMVNANKQNNTNDKYIEDLNYLSVALEEIHPDLYRKCSKEEIQKSINELKKSNLNKKSFEFGIMKILSKIGDPHTTIDIESNPDIFKYKFIDNKLYILDDYVNENSKYINNEVTAINDIPISSWVSKLSEYVSYDNESCLKKNVMELLNNASFMKELSGSDKLIYSCSDGVNVNNFDFVKEAQKGIIKEEKKLQCENIDDNTMYIKYGTCIDNQENNIQDFVAETNYKLEESMTQNIVVDLRGNKGGNSMWFKSMLEQISNVPNKTTLVDENTFSSGVIAMNDMQSIGSKVVGEEVALTENHFGNCKNFALPNTNVNIWCSTSEFVKYNDKLVQITKEEKVDNNNVKVTAYGNQQTVVPKKFLSSRNNFKLDSKIISSINDYRTSKDPVLDSVKTDITNKNLNNNQEKVNNISKSKKLTLTKKPNSINGSTKSSTGSSSGNSGYINALILTLITGFVMGVVSVLSYMFISK